MFDKQHGFNGVGKYSHILGCIIINTVYRKATSLA